MSVLLNVDKILKGTERLGEIPSEKSLISRTVKIAWPSITELFLVSLVSLVDSAMVGTLGAHAIAAVGLTIQPKFIGLAIFLSLSTAVSAIVARRKGERNSESANNVLKLALFATILLSVVVSVLCVTLAESVIHMMGSEPDTHREAVEYYKIIMGGMVFNVVSMIINAAQRGVGNTKITMRTNIVSNLVNVVLNYLLIGGKFGFPKLGVAGAAIATVCGTVVACAMSIASVMHKEQFLSLRGSLRVRFDKQSVSSILNIGSSTLVEQLFMRIGFLLFALIVTNLGTKPFAAHQIGINIMTISFSLGDGLSVAAVTLVGQSLGEKREDLAKIYGSLCQKIGLLFSLILSIVFIFFGTQLYMLFTDEAVILGCGNIILKMMTIIVFLQVAQVIYSGCLRGAGDTRFTALVSLVSIAIVRPILAWIFCYPLGLGLIGAWLGLSADQTLRFSLTLLRFRSGKWTNIKV